MSGDRYHIRDQNETYFLTFTVVFWIDVFTRKEYKHIIVDSLNYCIKEKGLNCKCVVSNARHLHLIASAKEGFKLSEIIRDFKKFTSKKIVDSIQTTNESRREWLLSKFEFAGSNLKRIKYYKFWKEDNHALLVDSASMLTQKLDYIHNNSVESEIVEDPFNYKYSSAADYGEAKGLVNIERALTLT